MSDQNPYDKLGVSEDASFDEIQDIRNRLLEECGGDSRHSEVIEAAYDAILMERLRMRQEGKIKVPERIRFPERLVQPQKKENVAKRDPSPAWLERLLDQPNPADIMLPFLWYLGLGAIGVFYQAGGDQVLQLTLVVGVVVSIYFLNRKEGKFGRSVLLTLIGLIVGLVAGAVIASLIPLNVALPALMPEQRFSTVVTFVLLWLISSFLR
ncbi:CPP1-like family protein [Calothrix sp. PCC 6303]|uniref:CPP1-like family protein n=1 Tax=Calothrix sp. PCC 6303 TaxID=1170562 RepID=UPI0002A054C3|nr:CPP1-like family protein [Calothrix sp. PCC 6303]AFY99251.1 hypothetical protein Cal6303_0143 [Calothrix sp. PCC 6303]